MHGVVRVCVCVLLARASQNDSSYTLFSFSLQNSLMLVPLLRRDSVRGDRRESEQDEEEATRSCLITGVCVCMCLRV